MDHLPVIQFDYAYVSSGDARGQQVKMRTILDTSTGYGTACVIDVKSAGDKWAISSAVSFLKELGDTRFRCRTVWKDGTVFCRDKSELCDWTLRRDLGQSLVLRISVYRGL